MSPENAPPSAPVIGLLGGLGVGAAIHYYRELAAAHERERRPMRLVMTHATIATATSFAARGARRELADYLAGFVVPLAAAGATFAVLPAVTPHLCIDELQAIAPIPIMDLTAIVAAHVRERGLSRVALFGTRYVVESDMFGRLRGVEIVRPQAAEVDFIHDAYTELAHTGIAGREPRQRFVELAQTLVSRDRVEAVVLAGTDFAVMFDEATTPFPHVDCTRAHVDAIVREAR